MLLHGRPIWYELTTQDAKASGAFYGPLLGWDFADSGMPGINYTLCAAGTDMVAALMVPDEPMPEFWMVYFAVDHCDETVARAKILGALVHRPPEDVPGTGRFAILTDPQGAAFGVLQPEDGDPGSAFDQAKPGHGNWQELNSTDPEAGFTFYAELLGWSASTAMDMGEMGKYQLFSQDGRDIGGMMRVQHAGTPSHWLPYFGVKNVGQAQSRIAELGGKVAHGPSEVPGGASILVAQDSRRAWFAVVGPA